MRGNDFSKVQVANKVTYWLVFEQSSFLPNDLRARLPCWPSLLGCCDMTRYDERFFGWNIKRDRPFYFLSLQLFSSRERMEKCK